MKRLYGTAYPFVKRLVMVVFTAEKKKCVLMFYLLLVDCLVIQSGSASWGRVEEMCQQFNPCSIWWGENEYFCSSWC